MRAALALTAVIVRASGPAMAAAAALHALLAAWTAWYLADRAWASSSTVASPTPLPDTVMLGAIAAASLVLIPLGAALGARGARGPWLAADPARAVLDRSVRIGAAWWAAAVGVSAAALAGAPVYLVLVELGVRLESVADWAALALVTAAGPAPLAGALLGAWRRSPA